jgi:hypothetical protein
LCLSVALVPAVVLAGCGSGHSSRRATSLRGQLIGMTFDGPAVQPAGLESQLELAVASGVESLRLTVNWGAMQPYRSLAQVPAALRANFVTVGGIPTRFADLDGIVGAAARHEVRALPVVLWTPRWAGRTRSSPPPPAAYAAFLQALVSRYGPRGSFWSSHPSIPAVPIRDWQVWNEPNFTHYWSAQPFARGYVALVAAARDAVRRADPGAEIVLGGFADFSWQYLAQIYAVPGARQQFDVVAAHPYTAAPGGVIEILRRVRAVMDRYGDRAKPLLATEITWPSSQGKAPPQFGVQTTESGQARLLGELMPLLAASRQRLGLTAFYWYTWMGDETPRSSPYGFDFAGLLKYLRGRISAKPALGVFRRWALRLEGCSTKRLSAVRCG